MMKQLKLNRLMLLAPLCAAGIAAVVLAAPAPQGAPGQGLAARIAVVNPSRIFNEMKETKALNEKMNGEMAKFEATRRQKVEQIEQLKKSRNDMRPDHPQYEELNNQLLAASADAEVWIKTQAILNDQRQKRQTKIIFEKVQAAVAEVAKQQRIDLVISDTKDVLPDGPELEKADIRAVKAAIYQKDVLYASDRLDISSDVLANLDAKFQAGAGPAPAAVGPPAGPGPNRSAIPAAGGQRGK
jgi:Skp family chaperone for outer membrane proteins